MEYITSIFGVEKQVKQESGRRRQKAELSLLLLVFCVASSSTLKME
jgi:hypothetical protein